MSSRPINRDLENLGRQAQRLRREWLRILVKELEEEVSKRNIKDTGALQKSLKGSHNSSVDVLHYLMYGAFVDMNVGKGRGLETQRENAMISKIYNQMMGRRNGRMAKSFRWYSKRMAREHKRLAELMAELYADAGVDAILAAIPDRIEILK
jgi:hypothetical protein